MNEVALKGLLKLAKSIISPDQAVAAADVLIKSLIDEKNKIELNSEKGEVTAVALLYEVETEPFISVGIINNDNKIVRFENVQPLRDAIKKLIKKL